MENKESKYVLECESLFQRAAEAYVVQHKKELAEFYLDSLSQKLKYVINGI